MDWLGDTPLGRADSLNQPGSKPVGQVTVLKVFRCISARYDRLAISCLALVCQTDAEVQIAWVLI